MKVFKYEITGEVSCDILSQLPPWRLSKALSYKRDIDRFLCAKAYLLLKEGLREIYGIDEDVEFEYSPSGKPYLKGFEGIHFNISHCPKCVCCAISDSPVGIDVEEIQYDRALAETVCNRNELDVILKSPHPEIEFTKLWTKKEALLKMTGEGLRNDLSDVLSSPLCSFHTEVFDGYICTSATTI